MSAVIAAGFVSCNPFLYQSGDDAEATSMKVEYLFMQEPSRSDLLRQGCAVYGDELFQFYTYNQLIDVFSIHSGQRQFSIEGFRNIYHHCNNIDFSNTFLNEGDRYPLLYVSMEDAEENKAIVYHISEDVDGRMFMEVVQTIEYPDEVKGLWPNINIDPDNGRLYLLAEHSGYNVREYDIPAMDQDRVKLRLGDCLDAWTFDSYSSTQDAVVRFPYLFRLYGTLRNGQIRVSDLRNNGQPVVKSFPRYGIGGEPEGLSVYGDDLVATFQDGRVYSLRLSGEVSLSEHIDEQR